MLAVQRDKDYSTEYRFFMEAKFSEYPDDIVFKHGPFPFLIRDYCIGMELSGAPNITALDEAFNHTQINSTGFWSLNITKYLISGKSNFIIDYMNYRMWQPSGATPAPAINTGCGTLTYNIT